MIVFAKEAEAKFLEELGHQKQELSRIKCMYIEFSKADVSFKKLFDEFLNQLENIPESYMAQVYICEDHDVFILMHAFMQGSFISAVKTMSHHFADQNFNALSTIYFLDEHHGLLADICQEKMDKILSNQSDEEKEREKQKSEQTTAEIMADLDINLIETLTRRRHDRRDPLILIVEDDQLSRTLVSNTIRDKYDSVMAVDGKEGLNEFILQAPDVVFLDIGLPDINGHDVLECMFQIDPSAYVIMFSGLKDKENIMRALRAGSQGFVGKPFTREKLFEYIGKSHFVQQKATVRQTAVQTG